MSNGEPFHSNKKPHFYSTTFPDIMQKLKSLSLKLLHHNSCSGDPDNIVDLLKPAFYLQKFLGLVPYSIKYAADNNQIQCFATKFDKFFHTVRLVVHCILLFVIIESSSQFFVYGNNKILGHGWMACISFKIISLISYDFHQIYKLKNIETLLNLLQDFDTKVNSSKYREEKLSNIILDDATVQRFQAAETFFHQIHFIYHILGISDAIILHD